MGMGQRFFKATFLACITMTACAQQSGGLPSMLSAPGASTAIHGPAAALAFTRRYHGLQSLPKALGTPLAPFVHLNGVLYGTAALGEPGGPGAFFSVDGSGRLKMLHSFPQNYGSGGQSVGTPAAITVMGRKFFAIGACPAGAITRTCLISIDVNGNVHVVHRFGHPINGNGGYLVADHRLLYGTFNGTVYRCTPSGACVGLWGFNGDNGAGLSINSLVAIGGTLYGTTSDGGANGAGTVFQLGPKGGSASICSFKGGSDGAYPWGSLAVIHGTIYGVTAKGGNYACSNGTATMGCGTVYAITQRGAERVLHVFSGGSNGATPLSVTDVSGTLYGTTAGLSTADALGSSTTFSVSTTGVFHTLHHFGGKLDGQWADPGLAPVNGALFGTAQNGGKYGNGVVFDLQP
jgi:uncharacterized repeat protein (TIGR03803 family)